MNRKLAFMLALPALTVFSGAALGSVRIPEPRQAQKAPQRAEHHPGVRLAHRGGQHTYRARGRVRDARLVVAWRARDSWDGRYRDRQERDSWRDRYRDPWGTRHLMPIQSSRPQRPEQRRPERRDQDRRRETRRQDQWHRERYVRDGRVYWRHDIRVFPRYDLDRWRGGYWHHGWHDGRWGWWWLVGGIWYYYAAPIYPYPNPYLPGTVIVTTNQNDATPPPPTQAPTQYWYHCDSPEGYYPYISQCSTGWKPVPATPPPSAPSAPPPGKG